MHSIPLEPGQVTGPAPGLLPFCGSLVTGILAAIFLGPQWSTKGREKIDPLRFKPKCCKGRQKPEFQEMVQKNSLIPVYKEGDEWVQYVKDWEREAVRVMEQIGMKVIKE